MICEELKRTIKNKPFFDVVGGCGVDTSNGTSPCMDRSGVWFRYCPFCGKRLARKFEGGQWNWWEEK